MSGIFGGSSLPIEQNAFYIVTDLVAAHRPRLVVPANTCPTFGHTKILYPLSTFVSFVANEEQMLEPQRTQRHTKDAPERLSRLGKSRGPLCDLTLPKHQALLSLTACPFFFASRPVLFLL
jgi:hypothetical protein